MKRSPWVSLVLLLVCYAGFGWYLSGLKNQPAWMKSSCERVFAPIVYPSSAPRSAQPFNPAFAASEPEPPTAGQAETPATRSELASPKPYGQPDAAGPTEESTKSTEKPEKERDTTFICSIIVRHNVHAGLLAIAWILLSSLAFISPITSFSGFISRWFRSDTVAFMTIVTVAGMAAVILYWLHVFLQILTILAADALARIDIQTAGMSGIQAFWLLVLVSLTGLIAGWVLNVFLI